MPVFRKRSRSAKKSANRFDLKRLRSDRAEQLKTIAPDCSSVRRTTGESAAFVAAAGRRL
jgi:hypothetical protein